MTSSHDHGNCELCDLLAEVIVTARDEVAALQARVAALRAFAQSVEGWSLIPKSVDWSEVNRQARALLDAGGLTE